MAVAEGFEPSDGGYPSHAFEACSLGRSDTPPCGSLPIDTSWTKTPPTSDERAQNAGLVRRVGVQTRALAVQGDLSAGGRRTPPAALRTRLPTHRHAPGADG